MKIVPLKVLQDHPNKPEFGQPCNGCGLCCAVSACNVSIQLLGSKVAPCVALEKDEISGKFFCGVYKRPHHYLKNDPQHNDAIRAELSRAFLFIGEGCGMPDTMVIIKKGVL